MRMLEGFSGSARLAQTFRKGGWEADTVDIKDGQDILTWEPTERYDYAHFAPPCGDYSGLRYDYASIWEADRTLWLRSFELVQKMRVPMFTIEGVKMTKWIWGKAPYHYGPFFLWGNFPFELMPKVPWTASFKGTHFDRATGLRWNERKTSLERATYPQSFCDALFQAANLSPRLKTEIVVKAARSSERSATGGTEGEG